MSHRFQAFRTVCEMAAENMSNNVFFVCAFPSIPSMVLRFISSNASDNNDENVVFLCPGTVFRFGCDLCYRNVAYDNSIRISLSLNRVVGIN